MHCSLNRVSLREWGESLKADGNPLGDSFIAYADAWDAEVQHLIDEMEDLARFCVSGPG